MPDHYAVDRTAFLRGLRQALSEAGITPAQAAAAMGGNPQSWQSLIDGTDTLQLDLGERVRSVLEPETLAQEEGSLGPDEVMFDFRKDPAPDPIPMQRGRRTPDDLGLAVRMQEGIKRQRAAPAQNVQNPTSLRALHTPSPAVGELRRKLKELPRDPTHRQLQDVMRLYDRVLKQDAVDPGRYRMRYREEPAPAHEKFGPMIRGYERNIG